MSLSTKANEILIFNTISLMTFDQMKSLRTYNFKNGNKSTHRKQLKRENYTNLSTYYVKIKDDVMKFFEEIIHWRNKKKTFLLHLFFWILYYLFFGLIWAKNGDYKSAFHLEFVLLPARMLAVYVTIYSLIPLFLLQQRFLKFLGSYLTLLLTCAITQCFFIYFFYENGTDWVLADILSLSKVIRFFVLINTTVFFVSTLYILNLYFREKAINQQHDLVEEDKVLTLKSNRRIYQVPASEIVYVEGLGNYVNYHLNDGAKIVVYQSLKKCLDELTSDFIRSHKSFIINKKFVKSYSNENVELPSSTFLPLSSSLDLNSLVL